MRWTHFTLPVTDLAKSIEFFVKRCGLSVVRDRRSEGGNTVWVGPATPPEIDPESVVVLYKGVVSEPLDHFGFQCETREEVTALAERAKAEGILIEGHTDFGGSVGYFEVLREPSSHLVESTYGQPMRGLSAHVA